MKALFLSSRRGRGVSELFAPKNQSESPLLDAQQHVDIVLGPVGLAAMIDAAHRPSPALCASVFTALMERVSTETLCGFSAVVAVQAVACRAGPPTPQSVSTMTSTPSGTEADTSRPAEVGDSSYMT